MLVNSGSDIELRKPSLGTYIFKQSSEYDCLTERVIFIASPWKGVPQVGSEAGEQPVLWAEILSPIPGL